MSTENVPMKFKPYTRQSIQQSPQWACIPEDLREAVQVISRVLPFRTNRYVMETLIDWNNIPDDPIYRLIFPHPDIHVTRIACAARTNRRTTMRVALPINSKQRSLSLARKT